MIGESPVRRNPMATAYEQHFELWTNNNNKYGVD